MKSIPLCVPEIRGREWDYIKECLDTNWVSAVGAFVDRFERSVAEKTGRRFAVATVNGTSALHIALLVAGVRPDEEVLVSTLTFIAPANAIRYAGAWPVFVDAEPDYLQMDIQRTVDFLEQGCQWKGGALFNRATGRKVSALLPVHILGHAVDMDPLLEAGKKYGLRVIEDATEGLGSTYRDRPVGALGDIACFSFNGNKIITTGGGGMLVTDDESIARRARFLTTQAKDDEIEYVHSEIGYNYRLTNIQAAMGCAQMELLDKYVGSKRAIADRYERALRGIPGLRPMAQAPWCRSTYWMYTMRVDSSEFGQNSRELLRALSAGRIQTRPLWQPLHRSLAHKGSHAVGGRIAEEANRTALSLPCSVGLTSEEQEETIARLWSLSAQAKTVAALS